MTPLTWMRPADWKPGDFLPSVQLPAYWMPMFEIKPDHDDLVDPNLLDESGCQCETYGDGEWVHDDEAMRWSPSPLERQRAALDIPEED